MKSIGKVILKIAKFLNDKGGLIIVWSILSVFLFAIVFMLYRLGQATGSWYVPVIVFVFMIIALMASSWGEIFVNWLEQKLEDDDSEER